MIEKMTKTKKQKSVWIKKMNHQHKQQEALKSLANEARKAKGVINNLQNVAHNSQRWGSIMRPHYEKTLPAHAMKKINKQLRQHIHPNNEKKPRSRDSEAARELIFAP